MRFLSVKVNWKVLGTDLSWPFSGYLYASHEGPGFSHLRGSHHHSSQPWTSHCESTTPSILTSSLSLQRPSLNCISSHPLLLFYHFLVTNVIHLLVLDSAVQDMCVLMWYLTLWYPSSFHSCFSPLPDTFLSLLLPPPFSTPPFPHPLPPPWDNAPFVQVQMFLQI